MKYYTPFGSGVSLDDLTCSQPTNKSCWNTAEPSEYQYHSGMIGKPVSSMRVNNNKFLTVTKSPEINSKTASRQVPESSTLMSSRLFDQLKNERNTDGEAFANTRSINGHRGDTFGHQNLAPNYHVVKTKLPKSTAIPGDKKQIVAEQHEKQFMASQEMFMRELNRLPPDLRRQYIDYMIASHLGLVPLVCPPTVPAVYCNVAVGPGMVPLTQMFTQPVIVPTAAGHIVTPTPLVSLQPVVPTPVTKSVIRYVSCGHRYIFSYLSLCLLLKADVPNPSIGSCFLYFS